MFYIKECLYCGESISNNRKYCSTICYNAYYYSKNNKCKNCNSLLPENTYNFCSKECDDNYHSRNCLNCNIIFYSINSKNIFCSYDCREKYYLNNPKLKNEITQNNNIILNKCLVCDSILSDNQFKYCSTDCEIIHKNSLSKNCIYCNNQFIAKNKNHKFCSSICRMNYNKKPIIPQINYLPSFELYYNECAASTDKTINYWNISGFTPELKAKILERDGHKCYICYKSTDLHVHHIVPRGQGGGHDPSNLITLCSGCHRSIESGGLENAIIQCTKRTINNIYLDIYHD